jgi:hypothetical protein
MTYTNKYFHHIILQVPEGKAQPCINYISESGSLVAGLIFCTSGDVDEVYVL